MYVCNCHGVREQEIASSIDAGHTTLRALRDVLGVGSCCGKCVCDVRRQLHDSLADKRGSAHHGCPGHCAAAAAGQGTQAHVPHQTRHVQARQHTHSIGVAEASVC